MLLPSILLYWFSVPQWKVCLLLSQIHSTHRTITNLLACFFTFNNLLRKLVSGLSKRTGDGWDTCFVTCQPQAELSYCIWFPQITPPVVIAEHRTRRSPEYRQVYLKHTNTHKNLLFHSTNSKLSQIHTNLKYLPSLFGVLVNNCISWDLWMPKFIGVYDSVSNDGPSGAPLDIFLKEVIHFMFKYT